MSVQMLTPDMLSSFVFFFSSRRRHTRCLSDWSSDVCSSDLEEPARAIGICLQEGGIGPTDVQYIHYHGTSTELNDRIETRAVKLAFEGPAYKLPGSSLKSMIGHPQGACGAAGIAATLLAMRDGVVPPTINVDQPDPN